MYMLRDCGYSKKHNIASEATITKCRRSWSVLCTLYIYLNDHYEHAILLHSRFGMYRYIRRTKPFVIEIFRAGTHWMCRASVYTMLRVKNGTRPFGSDTLMNGFFQMVFSAIIGWMSSGQVIYSSWNARLYICKHIFAQCTLLHIENVVLKKMNNMISLIG